MSESREQRETVAASAHPTAPGAPTVLGGRYQLLGLLGVGGMGSVYRARDIELDEVVALKMLRRDLVELPGMLERFRREVKLARRVTHKNVARTFDIGEHGPDRFLTMEYVEGEPLGNLMERYKQVPAAKIVEVAAGLCEGLGAAHAAGVIHRDLKPDNVLLARDGRVVITDFGIARGFEPDALRTAGAPVGTPAYMAPEQVEGASEIDARVDLYALGVMLYECATGELPWKGGSPYVIAAARLSAPAPDPRRSARDLPDGLARVILRCLARRPEDRFPTAEAVGEALADITRPPPAGEPPPPALEPPAPKTVAVLPFRNAGPPEDEYLADGLTDDLTDTLSMARGLRVRSRGGVRAAARADDPRAAGAALDVQVVVDGTVRRLPDGALRITTRVVSVADGFQLWARRFDRPAADVLKVAYEASRAIADALTVESAPARPAPTDPIALDLYLRARHEYHQFRRENLERAIALFEQALARSPSHPSILAGYANARARLWFHGGPDARGSGDLARAAAEAAVDAAPMLGEPRQALALVCFHSGDPARAVRELRRAIAVAPTHAEAHELYGRIAVEVGRIEEGVRFLETAVQLDPALGVALHDISRAHALAGRWRDAEAALARFVPGDGGRVARWLWRIRMAFWRRDREALEACSRDPLAGEVSESSYLRGLLQIVRGEAASELSGRIGPLGSGAEHSGRQRAFFHQLRAEVAGYLGDGAGALAEIRAGVDAGLLDLGWLDRCPLLAPARELAGFAAERARVEARAAPVVEALTAP